MNWCKIAQESPTIVSKLESLSWIDPNRIIYKISFSHLFWIFKNKNFIEEKYNIKLIDMKNEDDQKNIIKNKNILIENGWIRSRHTSGWYIDIKNLNNTKLIKFLGEKMFEALGPKSVEFIDFLIYDYNKEIEFLWQDFIRSGESFIDYIRSRIR